MRAWQRAPETAGVRVLCLGVDHDNVASLTCATAAGFVVRHRTPDWKGMVHLDWH